MANTSIQHPTNRHGFTLTELMVSIALVLILLLAINMIFDMTSKTIGGGQALSMLTRDGRAAESAFADDFKNILPPSRQPVLAIWSAVEAKFADGNDERADLDADAMTVDVDENGIEGEPYGTVRGERLPPTVPNTRVHRTDMLSFFMAGRYVRGTGTATGGTPLVDHETSREAWVQYGHSIGSDFKNGASRRLDMDSFDTNQAYANNWILARTLVLLRDPKGTPSAGGANTAWRDSNLAPPPYDFSPLTWQSEDGNGKKAYTSVADVADTTIDAYLAKVNAYKTSAANTWLFHVTNFPLFRVVTDPAPDVTNGIRNDELARMMPIFLQGCTQFIVEYAGDFLDQNPANGLPYATTGVYWDSVTQSDRGTDNEIDFVVDTVTKEKSIRWYGFPRDVNGDGAVTFDADVVPLRDLWNEVVPGGAAPFERFPNADARTSDTFPFATNKVSVGWVNPATVPPQDYTPAMVSLTDQGRSHAYYCVWEPGMRRPKLIRITVTIVDPNNRLSEGQTYQYIFKVPE